MSNLNLLIIKLDDSHSRHAKRRCFAISYGERQGYHLVRGVLDLGKGGKFPLRIKRDSKRRYGFR
jgi:hypothetical protein